MILDTVREVLWAERGRKGKTHSSSSHFSTPSVEFKIKSVTEKRQ